MTVAVEVSAAPEAIAGIAALTAIAAIEVAAIRWGKPPISPVIRYNVHKHPFIAAGIASYLSFHLTMDVTWDPAGWLARRFDRRHR